MSGLKFHAVPMKGGELKPGDLFSTHGPEYWTRDNWSSLGERVYIRTNSETPQRERDVRIFKITIHASADAERPS